MDKRQRIGQQKGVKQGVFLSQSTRPNSIRVFAMDDIPQFASFCQIHQHVSVIIVVKHLDQTHAKRMDAKFRQENNLSFQCFKDRLFFDHLFQCKMFPCSTNVGLDLPNFAKGTLSNHCETFKILQLDIAFDQFPDRFSLRCNMFGSLFFLFLDNGRFGRLDTRRTCTTYRLFVLDDGGGDFWLWQFSFLHLVQKFLIAEFVQEIGRLFWFGRSRFSTIVQKFLRINER
mmetsp:Transcript_16193/g.26329  ORF Transcript_16193/g.26329 Transcript_16193/m.26329 type:complete len:229 (-) Transcript_16193:140-826(-)